MSKFTDFLKSAWDVIWSRDTIAHGGCSAAASLALFVIFSTPVWEFPSWSAVVIAAVGAMVVGFACELVQYVMCPGWSKEEAKRDLVRDAIGIVLSFIPMGIYLFN